MNTFFVSIGNCVNMPFRGHDEREAAGTAASYLGMCGLRLRKSEPVLVYSNCDPRMPDDAPVKKFTAGDLVKE